jgi:small subunit ribosomal protein S24e
MNITITNKNENPLLHRVEVQGVVAFEGATPSNAQMTEAVASQLKTDVSQVVLRHIYNTFSKNEAKFEAVAYNSADARKKAERLTPQQKKKLEEEMKKAAEEKKKAKEAAKSE